jgi:flagellar assembly protein FliH
MTARIVNGSQPEDCTAWVPPTMAPGVSRTAALTATEADAIRRGAQADGYAAGRLEGLAAGRQEAQETAGKLALVLESLSRPFTVLDAAVEQELVALAFALARQLVRRELKADPGQIVGIVRDALQSLPVATRDIKVHLNPEDAKLVREHLPAVDQDRAWTIVEDPMLTRGGARVATATSQVDARLESRLGALVAELLGGDREGGRAAEAEQGSA